MNAHNFETTQFVFVNIIKLFYGCTLLLRLNAWIYYYCYYYEIHLLFLQMLVGKLALKYSFLQTANSGSCS